MSTKEKILIAEVKDIDAAHLKLMFQRRGCDVDTVKKGTDVLSKIEENNYTLIVLNEKLNDVDGVETVKRIRKREASEEIDSKIPIIGLTAYSLPTEKKQFQEAGINYCLSKPVYKNKIIKILKEVTAKKKDNLPSASSVD